jgi:hypothetical protein
MKTVGTTEEKAMQLKVGVISLAFAFMVGLPLMSTAGPNIDTDGDTVIDPQDNCTMDSNTDQKDTNLDGYGDRCDCDINNAAGGACGPADFAIFGGSFGSSVPPGNPDTDLSCDTAVGPADIALFGGGFGGTAGPSGLPCAGLTVPCVAE